MTAADTSAERTEGAGAPAVRIFLSSPSDVAEERAVALSVVLRVQGFLQGRLVLVPILWEQEPLLATAGFQQEIDRRASPASTDVAVFVLWARLGTPLSAGFVLEDGRRPTGTEWEFEDAVRAHRERGAPHILVYRKSGEPDVKVTDPDLDRRRADFTAVEAFFRRHFRDATDLSFTGAYHGFRDAAEFGRLLESHLTKLLTERLAGTAATVTWHGSPFRGLETFEAEHAPVFFGRARAIQDVRRALVSQVAAGRAFVLILGRSGNGKSSLARAGVLPMLAGPWLVEAGVERGFCRRAVMHPGAERTPVLSLAHALLAEDALPDLRSHGTAAELAALLVESPKASAGYVRGALRRTAERLQREKGLAEVPLARLLLLVDQMEECYTREGVSEEDRRVFADVLDALARSRDVYVLATLRSDFYPVFSKSGTLMALKEGAGQYDLPPLDAVETAQIVRGPAQAAGLSYEVDAGRGRSLDEVMLADATGSEDALPLLEYALTQLEERKRGAVLTFEAYEGMGRLEGAIATRAEAEWGQLPESARATFPTVLRALVEVGEREGGAAQEGEARLGGVTRRWAPLAEVTRSEGGRALVERFLRARLLVAQGDLRGGDATVGVAHEALLRAWPRARDRIATEGELLRIRSRVRTQASRWDGEGRRGDLVLSSGRPLEEARLLAASGFDLTDVETSYLSASEARARRGRLLRRVAVSVIAGLAVVAGVLALFAMGKQREAEESARVAAGERDAKANALMEVLRLADAKKVRDLEDEAAGLSPLQPDLAVRTRDWTRRVGTLLGGLSDHAAALDRLRGRADAPGPPWRFADGALDWQHQVLEDLVKRLRALGDPTAPVPARIERLRRVEASVEDPAWGPAIERVAGNARYRGLHLAPQTGLVPLGPDPDSGLEEFAYVGSGSVPTRSAATRRLACADDTAIVLVLIPGGTFWMGAQKEDPARPNHDPEAQPDESPVHEVTLSAFFMAKHECTQAQWKLLAEGEEPSWFKEGPEAPRRPVEQVSWDDCRRWLPEHRLALPTEAQWEYACRAGTSTAYWSGPKEEDPSRVGWYGGNAANTTHPVGGKPANGFGLHDVHGNVSEWCQDAAVGYGPEAVTDPVVETGGTGYRVGRGGGWLYDAWTARSASRPGLDAWYRVHMFGVRPARPVAPR